MNALIAVLFCVSAVFALSVLKPHQNTQPGPIPTQIPNLAFHIYGPNKDGSYSYNYETRNGIQVGEEGKLVKIGKEDSLRVEGFFSYPDADSKPIALSYVADENGFQPKGDHLPLAPPVPSGILKALEYIALHPEEDNL